jgi:hypothetical protein
MNQQIYLSLPALLAREVRTAPDEQCAAARLPALHEGQRRQVAHRACGRVDELVGTQGRERLVVAGALGVFDGELHLVPLGEALGARRTVVLRARGIHAQPGRSRLAALAERRVAAGSGRQLACGRDSVRRGHAFAQRLRAAQAIGAQPVAAIGVIGARPAACGNRRACPLLARDRAAAPHDRHQVLAVAVCRNGNLAVAHLQGFTPTSHDQALQDVRMAGLRQHGDRRHARVGAHQRNRPLRVVVVELREADRVEDVVGVTEEDAQLAFVLDGPPEIRAEECEPGLRLDGSRTDQRPEDLRWGGDLARHGTGGQPREQDRDRGPSNHLRRYIVTTTLPCAIRSISMRTASCARSSGTRAETYGVSVPSAIHAASSIRLARAVAAS